MMADIYRKFCLVITLAFTRKDHGNENVAEIQAAPAWGATQKNLFMAGSMRSVKQLCAPAVWGKHFDIAGGFV